MTIFVGDENRIFNFSYINYYTYINHLHFESFIIKLLHYWDGKNHLTNEDLSKKQGDCFELDYCSFYEKKINAEIINLKPPKFDFLCNLLNDFCISSRLLCYYTELFSFISRLLKREFIKN